MLLNKQKERAWIESELVKLYRELDEATDRALFSEMHRLIDRIHAMEKVRDLIL
ncbi:hypothetical protein SynMEDNS5_01770 [Synechococcus sp. MEDNS5]|nr:hypothetical protein SynMEDNS5_01770 [Synechococcus sp. MEDNS5]